MPNAFPDAPQLNQIFQDHVQAQARWEELNRVVPPRLRRRAEPDVQIIDDVPNEVRKAKKTELPEGKLASKMPPFKLNYSNWEEVSHRLRNSMIVVKGLPYVVEHVEPARTGEALLYLTDGETRHVVPITEITSVRSLPPMYVNCVGDSGTTAYWFCRVPSTPQGGREQQHHGDYMQGMTTRNTMVKAPGKQMSYHGTPSLWPIIRGLKNKEDVHWDSKIEELMVKRIIPNIRLSDTVAVYLNKSVQAEYKGRTLGMIKDDRVQLSEEDRDTPWIYSDLQSVGLRV